jgi:hypothetical protein
VSVRRRKIAGRIKGVSWLYAKLMKSPSRMGSYLRKQAKKQVAT